MKYEVFGICTFQTNFYCVFGIIGIGKRTRFKEIVIEPIKARQ